MFFSEYTSVKPVDAVPVQSYKGYTFRDLYYSRERNEFYQYDGYVYTVHKVFNYDTKRGPCAHVKADNGEWITLYTKCLNH